MKLQQPRRRTSAYPRKRNARVHKLLSIHAPQNFPTLGTRIKSLIHFSSKTSQTSWGGHYLAVIVAITIIIFRAYESDVCFFWTSTSIIQVGSMRHNYANRVTLLFQPLYHDSWPLVPSTSRALCISAPAKLHFPAAAATKADWRSCSCTSSLAADRNPWRARFTCPRSLVYFPVTSCNYFV